jgi:polar amino acid transport system substrate-binding protein
VLKNIITCISCLFFLFCFVSAEAWASFQLASADDLKDKRLGVLLGSIHDAYAHKTYPKATVLQYKSPSDMLLALKAEKVDAVFYIQESLFDLIRTNPEFGLVGPPLFSDPIAIGFSKTNNTLREAFNRFLQKTKASGLYDDMVRRWITEGSTKMPEISTKNTNGLLTIGIVSDKGLPFAAVKNNRLVGFDIELMERFAADLGKTPNFRDLEFGGLIAATVSGKVDLIASTIMITEERKKQIAFSDSYYALGTVVLALKKNIATGSSASAGKQETACFSFFNETAKSFHSNILHEQRYLLIFDGLKTTVIISILASLGGTLLGALVCFMRMSKNAVVCIPAKIYISIIRGTPVLVLLMLIFYVVFASVNIDPVVVAVIAFGMNFAAYVAEIFRSGIEGIDKGQTEAGIALGFSKVQTFIQIILPQMVQRVLPVYKGEFISLVKMTSIVGYIAVQDLTKASDIIRSRTFDAFFPLVMVAVLYFLISWILLLLLETVERKCDPKQNARKVRTA